MKKMPGQYTSPMALCVFVHGYEKLKSTNLKGSMFHRLRQWQALDQQRKQYESEVLGEIDWEMGRIFFNVWWVSMAIGKSSIF